MMFGRVICSLALIVCGHVLAAPPENPTDNSEPWNAGPAPNPKDRATWNFANRSTGGFVQSITKDGITLYRPELEIQRFRHDPLTGQLIEAKKKETQPAWPAKKFALSEELVRGSYSKTASPENTYRITDLRVGDWVVIEYCRQNGVDICKTLCIHRRPGGLIPPAPGEKPDAFRKYHELANADQDWEEKRIAYPRKYWPSFLGKDGKVYDGPYPNESIQIKPKLALAPAPREVKPNR